MLPGLITVLDSLAQRAHEMANAVEPGDLPEAYEDLLEQVRRLNGQYEWASSEEFGAMFPTVAAHKEIRRLSEAMGGRPPCFETTAAIRQSALDLNHWLGAIALARRNFGSILGKDGWGQSASLSSYGPTIPLRT